MTNETRVRPRVTAKQFGDVSGSDHGIASDSFLARDPVHRGGLADDSVEQRHDFRAVARPAEHRLDRRDRCVGHGIIRLDLRPIAERVVKDSLLEVPLNVGERGFGIGELVFRGFAGEKLHQLRVAGQPFKDRIVGQREVVNLHTRVVPGGNVTRARRAFVHHTFLAKVERRIKISHAIEQHAGLVGIGQVSRGHVGRGETSDSADDGLLPLAEDEVSADEPPALAVLHAALAVIHAEAMQRVGRVRMICVKEQRAVSALRIEHVLLIQA